MGNLTQVSGHTSGPKFCDIDKEEAEEMAKMEGMPTCYETEKAYIGNTVFYPGTDKEYVEGCPGPKHCQVNKYIGKSKG